MSYRVRINRFNKGDLLERLENRDSMIKKEGYFYLEGELESIEIHNELDLEQFNNLIEYDDDEYASKKLKKEDFNKVLEHYRKQIVSNAEERESEATKIICKLNDEGEISKDLIYDIKSILTSVSINEFSTARHFSKKTGVKDANTFLIQYFYLIKVFEELNDDEVLVITHG